MFEQDYNNLYEAEKEEFRRVSNYLLSKTFIVLETTPDEKSFDLLHWKPISTTLSGPVKETFPKNVALVAVISLTERLTAISFVLNDLISPYWYIPLLRCR